MKLEGEATHHGAIRPALPTTDRKFLLKLLQLEIGAHPPPAAVFSFALSARQDNRARCNSDSLHRRRRSLRGWM